MGTRRREGRPAPATARSARHGRAAGCRAQLRSRHQRTASCHDRRADWAGPGGAVASRRSARRRRAGRGPHHRPARGGQDVSRRAPGQRRRSRHQRERPRPGKDSDRPGASAARGRLREPTTRRRLTQPGATPPGQPTQMHGRRLASGRARLGRRSSGRQAARYRGCARAVEVEAGWLAVSRGACGRAALPTFDGLSSTAVRRSVVRGLASLGLALVDPLGQLVQRPGCHRLPRRPAVTAAPPADEAEAIGSALQHVPGSVLLHPGTHVDPESRASYQGPAHAYGAGGFSGLSCRPRSSDRPGGIGQAILSQPPSGRPDTQQ